MEKNIAITGIGVINGSAPGVNRFNQSIYDCTFDGSFLEANQPEELIKSAVKDTKSDIFKDGFLKSTVIQIADKTPLKEIQTGLGFSRHLKEPDLFNALSKATLLLSDNSHDYSSQQINSVIIIGAFGAIVVRDIEKAVLDNDRIYSLITKTSEKKAGGISLLTICCDNFEALSSNKLKKTASFFNDTEKFFSDIEKESIAVNPALDEMTGLITTALCIYNRYLPGQKLFNIPGDISIDTPFYFPFSSRTFFPLKKREKRRAVLSLTKKNLTLSEYVQERSVFQGYFSHSSPVLFPVTAETKEELKVKLNQLSAGIDNVSDIQKHAKENFLEYQKVTKKKFIAVVNGITKVNIKKDAGFIASGLDNSFSTGKDIKTPGGSYFTPLPLGEDGKIVFVYPGVGSAYTGLGQDLFQMFPYVYDLFSNLVPDSGSFIKERDLYPRTGKKPTPEDLKKNDKNIRKNIKNLSQCGMSFSVIYTMILAGVFNIFPEFALGYSLGEASMMASLMVWENPEELNEKLKENDVIGTALSGDLSAVRKAWDLPADYSEKIWESYTLIEDRKKIEALVRKEDKVYITLVNTDNELVIAGDPASCLRVIDELGCKFYPLNLDLAIHSEPAYLAYDKLVDLYSLKLNEPSGIKLYSSSCYLPVPLREKSIANSIAKAFCDTVDFPKLIRKVHNDGGRIFIEAGPRKTCSSWIDQILEGENFLTIPLNVKGLRDQDTMARAVAMLISHKVNINVESFYKY